MSNDIVIDAVRNLDRVGKISRRMQKLLWFGMVVVLGWPIAAWGWGEPAWLLKEYAAETIPVTITPVVRIACYLITMTPGIMLLMALNEARKLFDEFARGTVFTLEAATRLRRMAMWLVGLSVTLPIYKTAVVLAMTIGNPAGQRYLTVTLQFGDYLTGMVGGLLLVIALVMAEAARISEENKGFV